MIIDASHMNLRTSTIYSQNNVGGQIGGARWNHVEVSTRPTCCSPLSQAKLNRCMWRLAGNESIVSSSVFLRQVELGIQDVIHIA